MVEEVNIKDYDFNLSTEFNHLSADDEIVGKYVTKQNQTPSKQQSSGTLGGTYKDESLVKFYNNLTNNDISKIIYSLSGFDNACRQNQLQRACSRGARCPPIHHAQMMEPLLFAFYFL
jgi:hypothetical protein